jgi:hypothetical protein
MGAMVRPGESVLDIGAGSQELALHIPMGCAYTAADCVPGPAAVPLHFGEPEVLPEIDRGHYDVAVLAGVLEYIEDPRRALHCALGWARRVLFSYHFADDVPDLARRTAAGWVSHLSWGDIGWVLRHRYGGPSVPWRPVALWDGQGIVEAGELGTASSPRVP